MLGACSMAPHYDRPASPVPPSWPAGDAYLAQTEHTLPAIRYTDIFRDPKLQKLIEQGLANNRDLRVSAANIAKARAEYHIQRAELLPQIDAGASAGYGRTVSGTTAFEEANYSASAGVTAFELDLFGRIKSLSDAALDRYFGTEAAARATRLAMVGDIANAWLNYGADMSLLQLDQETVASAEKSVQLTRRRLEAGVAPRTDVRQAETILTAAQTDLARQRTQLAQDINALQLLTGAPVDPTLLPGSITETFTNLGELPAGLDSGILLRRPDVVEAEYTLRAANAEIGAARADLFPRISLTSLAGVASDALSKLFTAGAFTWQASGSVTYPIFRAGAGKANVRATEADRDAALATYEKTIQTAFREVSDALARRGTIDDQIDAGTRFVAATDDNFRLTDARYKGGVASYLESLDAQRSLYNARRVLIATQLAKAQNLVELYRTLGGDMLTDAPLKP
jgi:multidrug efflux system outer membrane protein